MKKDTGGMAFPVPETEFNLFHEGMTLRDYFAAKAMAASLGARNWGKDSLAEQSYKMADAMLKARSE